MAKKSVSKKSVPPITFERASRLLRLVNLIGNRKQTRGYLIEKLKIGVRDFYRDVETLRELGVEIVSNRGGYSLQAGVTEARERIPVSLTLSLGEAETLAKGSTPTHKKLAKRVREFKSSAAG